MPDPVSKILADLDKLRNLILSVCPENQEIRSLLRQILEALEKTSQVRPIDPDTFGWLRGLLVRLMDAEHGAWLKDTDNGPLPADVSNRIEQHINERRRLIDQAGRDLPAMIHGVDACCLLLGARLPDETGPAAKIRFLEQQILQHLKHDEGLRLELKKLVEALSPALEAMHELVEEVGEEAPELRQARELLSRDLPDDAKAAHALLQQARNELLRAGEKIVRASDHLRQSIQQNLQQMAALSEKLETAKNEARNDPLTRLANRRRLAEFLTVIGDKPFTFMILDVDHFKKINDRFGHDTGDEILRQIGTILSSCIRSNDLAARLGGEEFCLVLPKTDLEPAIMLAERIRQAIEMHPFKTSHGPIPVTLSIGVASCKGGSAEQKKVFRAADQALYEAKNGGRNQVKSASPS